MRKILVHGFPHSGTTILKSIIGHCTNVHEVIEEETWVTPEMITTGADKEFVVIKCPYTHDGFMTDKYSDYIRVFIIRDPRYVFSSLNKRFRGNLPVGHTIPDYVRTAGHFQEQRGKPGVYCIRYEDMFDHGFSNIKDMFNKIGLEYTDKIFSNAEYTNKILNDIHPKDVPQRPENTNHGRYRTWQINQEFVNNNDPAKIDLHPTQLQELQSNRVVQELYPF